MKLPVLPRRLTDVLALLLLFLPFTAGSLRAAGETREQVGTVRFALRDLPPLLAPVQGTHSYLVNGKNANWYDDREFPRGTVRAEVNYLSGNGPGSVPPGMTTYRVILTTDAPSGQPPTRRRQHHLEGDKFRINLFFASGDASRQPTRADLVKAFGRHIVFEADEKKR